MPTIEQMWRRACKAAYECEQELPSKAENLNIPDVRRWGKKLSDSFREMERMSHLLEGKTVVCDDGNLDSKSTIERSQFYRRLLQDEINQMKSRRKGNTKELRSVALKLGKLLTAQVVSKPNFLRHGKSVLERIAEKNGVEYPSQPPKRDYGRFEGPHHRS